MKLERGKKIRGKICLKPTSHFRLHTSDFRLQTSHFRLHTSDFILHTFLPCHKTRNVKFSSSFLKKRRSTWTRLNRYSWAWPVATLMLNKWMLSCEQLIRSRAGPG